MKIVIQDDYQDCIKTLACYAAIKHHEVTIYTDHVQDPQALVARFKDAQALVLIRERTVLTRAVLEQLVHLKVISQTGKVASHIDLQACHDLGITVMDGHGRGGSTAELTMLLILASLRNLVVEWQRLQQGQWQGTLGQQLSGKVLGIYGYGRIGAQIAHLGKAFGAEILIWGRENSLKNAAAEGFAVASSKAVFFQTCDVLSLQIRLAPENWGIVTLQDLLMMKPSAILINTSRAELIEAQALEKALTIGRPGYAAVDVYENEPVLERNHPLLSLPNCLCTPHLGFVEKDNYEAYFGIAFDNINAYNAGKPHNVVTVAS